MEKVQWYMGGEMFNIIKKEEPDPYTIFKKSK